MPQPLLALLSDLDGTLLDTEPLYFNSYVEAALSLGKNWKDEQHVRCLLGKPQSVGISSFLEELGLTGRVTHDELLRLRDRVLLPSFSKALALPGAAGAIACCQEAGMKLAVVTSSKRELVALKSANERIMMDKFSLFVCCDDEGLAGKPGKPSPDCYLYAAAALGVAPSACLCFEDSMLGIQAAVAAGCVVVAIPDPRLSLEDVKKAGPFMVLSSLEDFSLSNLLEQLNNQKV